jgi:hypothetical protein
MSTTSSEKNDISIILFTLTLTSTLTLSQVPQGPRLHGRFRDFSLNCRPAVFHLQSPRLIQGIAYVQFRCRLPDSHTSDYHLGRIYAMGADSHFFCRSFGRRGLIFDG